jgi:coenzyme F420-reducing hydrogenase gamma subunit
MPIDQVIDVDYYVHGCPIYPAEFIKVLKAALAGVPYYVPEYSVCIECKFNENVCMYDRGVSCMGPITRAGCNSWCINNGNICYGCRGILPDHNKNAFTEILEKHNISMNNIVNKNNMYNSCGEDEE